MLQSYRLITFRPSSQPALLSPLTVRSVGHYRVNGWSEDRPPRGFSQIFRVSNGALEYERGGKQFTARAGDTFHFCSDERHCLTTGKDGCEYWWATFDGELVGNWLTRSNHGPAPRTSGPCPVAVFEKLLDRLGKPSLAAEREAAELGLDLLIEIFGTSLQMTTTTPSPDESFCQELETLMESNHTDPDFGIEKSADILNCHRSTLFRTYREKRGIAPSTYLQRLRLQHGLKLLKTSPLSITEIANVSGFRDVNYFSKVIRDATGESPRTIRRANPGEGMA